MRRKIVAFNFDAHGHVNPTLPLTRELVARGVDVTYCVPESFAEIVRKTGARHVPYDSIFTSSHATKMQTSVDDMIARFPLRLVEEAEHVLPRFLEILRVERPHALIYDNMCLAGQLAAKILDIPLMSFRPSYVANEHFSLTKRMPLSSESNPYLEQAQQRYSALEESYKVKASPISKFFMNNDDLNIVFMPRAFHPCGDTFDERFAFVGPQIPPRFGTEDFVLPAGDEPLLLVSLGTVFNDWIEFFHMVFEAFGGKRWRVLVAYGDRIDPAKLGIIPSNVIVQRHWPQLEVLSHTSVFLTHGGMNSVQESIWFGVPMVVIPQMFEQAETAQRVQDLELGRSFFERVAVTPHSLSEAVAEVDCDAKYRANILAMREHSRAAGGYMRAADIIEAELAKY